MNSAQSYFLISLLLITALIAIICLLILATDQPDALIEGQRRIVLSPPKNYSPQISPTQIPKQWENVHSTQNSQFPIEIPLEKIAEFGPSDGGKFMSISIVIDKNMREMLFLAKNDGQIEIRELGGKNGPFGLFRSIKLPIPIYRLRPLNSTFSLVLDSTFSRIQLWDVENTKLKGELFLEHPAKDIALEGDKVFALGRFEGRIDCFDLSNGQLRPLPNSSFHLGQHCQSLARTSQSSLLLSCPSGLLEISAKDGRPMQNFDKIEGIESISALQVLSSASGNVVLGASGIRREMLIIDWSGRLKARMRIGEKAEEGRGIWLWTGLAMFGERIYALEYFGNKVEMFKFENNSLI